MRCETVGMYDDGERKHDDEESGREGSGVADSGQPKSPCRASKGTKTATASQIWPFVRITDKCRERRKDVRMAMNGRSPSIMYLRYSEACRSRGGAKRRCLPAVSQAGQSMFQRSLKTFSCSAAQYICTNGERTTVSVPSLSRRSGKVEKEDSRPTNKGGPAQVWPSLPSCPPPPSSPRPRSPNRSKPPSSPR